jgi:hypothetical protein
MIRAIGSNETGLSRSIGIELPAEDFGPQNADRRRRRNADAGALALDRHQHHPDVPGDHDLFSDPAREH